jgi:hypothetical protein
MAPPGGAIILVKPNNPKGFNHPTTQKNSWKNSREDWNSIESEWISDLPRDSSSRDQLKLLCKIGFSTTTFLQLNIQSRRVGASIH